MTMPISTIELTEYQAADFPAAAIPEELGRILWEKYRQQIQVEAPSFMTNHHWRLTAQGWVGHIPLSPEVRLLLKPKVELSNLFRMWEYAYRLNNFNLPPYLVESDSLPEFYERLAHILALKVMNRARQGLHRAYLPQTEALPYVRGRLDPRPQRPGHINLTCHYEERTADTPDNQILAWTLWRIAHSGLCSERIAPAVRRALHYLHGPATLTPHGPQDCLGRLYHRLNEDYRPLHALCRFFLDQTGPGHTSGDRAMLPFLVDMARLFELFVVEWLRANLPAHLELKEQETVNLNPSGSLHFRIDISLCEKSTGLTRCVLDTKYKTGPPATADIAQVMAYAQVKGCSQAILVYPAPPPQPLDALIGGIRVRSLTFNLSGNLEEAGDVFLQALQAG